MFSRSSSVGSLNSFEQHSIVDDRSSVSAFSNLASGMISPSEIPDYPFEVASPFITKSKNDEFLFLSNDQSEDHVLVDQTVPKEDFPDEKFGDDDVRVYDDEGDCNSVSNLRALSINANSTHKSISVIQDKNTLDSLTQKTSVTVNCSVTNGGADFIGKCQNLDICDKSDVLEQSCIGAIPSYPSDTSQSEKIQSIMETKYEDKGTSTSEDFDFRVSGYDHAKMSSPLENMMKEIKKFNDLFHQYKESCDVPNCSFSDIDVSDEDDDGGTLIECVLPKSNSMQIDAGKSSVCEISSCSNVTTNELPISNSPSRMMKLSHDTKLWLQDASKFIQLAQEWLIELESIKKNMEKRSFAREEEFSTFELIAQSKDQLDDIKNDLDKSDNDLDDDESNLDQLLIQLGIDIKNDLDKSDDDLDDDEINLLVQELIQLGMPKSQLRSPKSQKETKLPLTYPPNNDLGCRDNCPDGVSDGEDDDEDKIFLESVLNNSLNSDNSSESEDDEVLQQCIRLGWSRARRVTGARRVAG